MVTTFGKFLRKIRIDHDEYLYDMAQKLGVTSAYLSAVENGKRTIPGSWIGQIITMYCLSDQDAKDLEDAAQLSAKTIEVNIDSASELQKRVALSFARKFDSFSHDDLEKMLKFCQSSDNIGGE